MQNNKEYQGQPDEMLIEILRGGQPELMDFILEKYKFLVRKRGHRRFDSGRDDWAI